MNEWVEERCEAIRLALRITGFPEERHLYQFLEWLGDNVELEHGPIQVPKVIHRPGRPALILMPEKLYGKPFDHALIHEIGHVLLSLGIGELLRQEARGNRRLQRLAATWRHTDERRAEEFLGAWLLPSALVKRYRHDPGDLAERAGVSWEFVQSRILSLQGRVVELTAAPKWSAYRTHHVICRHEGRRPHVSVAARGSAEPLYSFHVTPAEVQPLMFQLTADLCALTEEEFARRHEQDRCLPPEPADIDLPRLQAWWRGGCDVA